MTINRRALRLATVVAAGALALAACSSSGSKTSSSPSGGGAGFNAAITSVVNPSTATGGTLNMGASGDCDSWDPANTYYAWCWDMQRLLHRTLMAYKSAPGVAGTTVIPDLAAAPGTHNADSTQWTYKLQDGLKWQDGSPLTSADVKYGIERLFATDVFATGAGSYYTCLLSKCGADGAPAYKGPYADPSGDLPSITTPDAQTVVFKLNESIPAFDYYVALATSAPISKGKDTRAKYTTQPFSSGPFQVSSYAPGKSMVLVRNPNWSQATDQVRKPLLDKLNLTIFANSNDIDNRLKAGTLDVIGDAGVQQAFQTTVQANPDLKKNADNPATGYDRYFAIMQTVEPLTNIDCRKAIFYAINKVSLRLARGGLSAGAIATSMAPSSVPGYESPEQYNPYPNGADFTGDVTKAKEALTACGKPDGFDINIAYSNSTPKGAAVFAAAQQALAKVGINAKPTPHEQAGYYSTFIGQPKNVIDKKLGMGNAAWAADFPSLNGFWQSIVSGKSIKPTGTSNYASLNDPTVNKAIDDAALTTDATQLETLGKTISHGVMDSATYLPYLWDSSFYYRNPRMTNVYLNPGLGVFYDYVNIGVSDGK